MRRSPFNFINAVRSDMLVEVSSAHKGVWLNKGGRFAIGSYIKPNQPQGEWEDEHVTMEPSRIVGWMDYEPDKRYLDAIVGADPNLKAEWKMMCERVLIVQNCQYVENGKWRFIAANPDFQWYAPYGQGDAITQDEMSVRPLTMPHGDIAGWDGVDYGHMGFLPIFPMKYHGNGGWTRYGYQARLDDYPQSRLDLPVYFFDSFKNRIGYWRKVGSDDNLKAHLECFFDWNDVDEIGGTKYPHLQLDIPTGVAFDFFGIVETYRVLVYRKPNPGEQTSKKWICTGYGKWGGMDPFFAARWHCLGRIVRELPPEGGAQV